MRALRTSVAVLVGLWLYYFAVVFMGGIFAAVAAPRSYFAYFGREQRELALALLSLVGWALPVGLLVTGGLLALFRLLPGSDPPPWKAALAGMIICFGYWALISVSSFSSAGHSDISPSQAMRITFTFPWWSAPNFFAPWLGFALATWLINRSSRPARPSEA